MVMTRPSARHSTLTLTRAVERTPGAGLLGGHDAGPIAAPDGVKGDLRFRAGPHALRAMRATRAPMRELARSAAPPGIPFLENHTTCESLTEPRTLIADPAKSWTDAGHVDPTPPGAMRPSDLEMSPWYCAACDAV
jgi:hypothetical protein